MYCVIVSHHFVRILACTVLLSVSQLSQNIGMHCIIVCLTTWSEYWHALYYCLSHHLVRILACTVLLSHNLVRILACTVFLSISPLGQNIGMHCIIVCLTTWSEYWHALCCCLSHNLVRILACTVLLSVSPLGQHSEILCCLTQNTHTSIVAGSLIWFIACGVFLLQAFTLAAHSSLQLCWDREWLTGCSDPFTDLLHCILVLFVCVCVCFVNHVKNDDILKQTVWKHCESEARLNQH